MIFIEYDEKITDYGKIIADAVSQMKDGDTLEFGSGEFPVGGKYLDRCFYYVSNNTSCEKKIAFHLKNKKNVSIIGHGSKLIFTDEVTPFVVSECENVKISGFDVDYLHNYHLEFDIIRVTDGAMTVRCAEGFAFSLVDGKAYLPDLSKLIYGGLTMAFDPELKRPSFRTGLYFFALNQSGKDHLGKSFRYEPVNVTETVDGCYKMETPYANAFSAGQKLIMCVCSERRDQVFLLNQSQNTVIEDVNISYSPSMGVIAQFCEDLSLQRVRVERNGRHGMVSSLCDAVHCVHCTGKLTLCDCRFFNMMDDALNVHGIYTQVIKTNGNTALVKLMEAQQQGVNSYRPGDVLTVYKGHTLDKRCEFIVEKSELKSGYEIEISGKINGEEITDGDIVSNPDRMPEIEASGCACGDNRPRGFLLTSSKKTVIDGCRFSDCEHGIECAGDTVYWYEADRVNDLTVKNCVFENCNHASGNYAIVVSPKYDHSGNEKYYHRNIKIKDNLFLGFSSGILYADGVDGISVTGNRYRYEGPYPALAAPNGTFCLENCANLFFEDNYDERRFWEDARPFWLCDRQNRETVVFLEGEERSDLLYDARKILRVTDYAERTVYREGVDYRCVDGKIERISDNIPSFSRSEFYRLQPDRIGVEIDRTKVKFDTDLPRWFKFDEIEYRAVKVDYEREGKRVYSVPESCADRTKSFRGKLSKGESARLCFYGDSITEGADSSACRRIPPYIDKWADQLTEFLKIFYRNDKLTSVNVAKGGKDSLWGLENFESNVLDNNPDLLILAFGMNDGECPVEEFGNRIEKMIRLLRGQNEKSEIVLVATALPNPQSRWFLNQQYFGKTLKELAEKYSCAFCDMGKLTGEIFAVKNYRDCTTNNVNHMNDFGTKIYLHSLLNVILGEEYEKIYLKDEGER